MCGQVVANNARSIISGTTNLSDGLPVINNTIDLSKGLLVINNTTDLSEKLPVINNTSAKMTNMAYDLCGQWLVWLMTCMVYDLSRSMPAEAAKVDCN